MSYPNDLDSVKALFASHGAQIYWNNWAETKLWYWSCMMPEMLRAQNDVLKQSKEKSKRGRKKKKRRKKKRTEEVWNRGMEVDVQGEITTPTSMPELSNILISDTVFGQVNLS